LAQLERKLGLGSAVALVVGEVIAVGIFLTPAGMAKALGSPFWLLVVWLLMGAMALCGALCYGELAARSPEAGGGYIYLREAYGERLAFLYGWKCFLVMDPGITAALAVGLGRYAGYLVKLSPWSEKAIAIGGITVLALVNIRGVELGARVMRILTMLKLGALATIAMWAVLFGLGNWANFMPFVSRRPGSEPFAAAFATALVGAFFAFGGWWDASKLTGEVRDPERTLPRALALGVVAVTFVYITTSTVFIYLVPMERVTSGETFAAQAGEALFGRSGGIVFSLVVIVSILGSLASLMLAAPRVYYAMARDGIFFTSIARLHPKFGTPWLAITLQAVMAALLALSGSFGQIVAYFVFVTVIFIALTVAAVFRLHRRMLPATVFLALVSLLLVLVGSNNPKQALLGMAVVALGAPVYYIFKKKEYQP